MASIRENEKFVSELFGAYPLDNAIEFIAQNLDVTDVFDADTIYEAVDNMTSDPADVFSFETLKEWALNNGFVEEISQK